MRAFSTRATQSPLVSATTTTTTTGPMSVSSRGPSARSIRPIGAGAVAAGGTEAGLPIRRRRAPPTALPAPKTSILRPRQRFSSRRGPAPCQAVLTDRGTRVDASEITIKRSMGEGSYGQVFEVSFFSHPRFEISTERSPRFFLLFPFSSFSFLFPSQRPPTPPTSTAALLKIKNKKPTRERSPPPPARRASSSSA